MAGLLNYWLAIAIIMIGFYGIIASRNLMKQAIALGLFQTGVYLFYVTMGVYRADDGTPGIAPIWADLDKTGPFDNPLPHVLMLTAIVVSVSTLAVAVALIVNIQRKYGTIEEDEILEADQAFEDQQLVEREASPHGGRRPSTGGGFHERENHQAGN